MQRIAAAARRTAGPRKVKRTRRTANKFKDSYDPNGSYTGTPVDGGKPIQDVDDL